MVVNLEGYRNRKVEIIKVPIYSRIYIERNTVIGEFLSGEKAVIVDIDKEG